jgi:hypothetical protein
MNGAVTDKEDGESSVDVGGGVVGGGDVRGFPPPLVLVEVPPLDTAVDVPHDIFRVDADGRQEVRAKAVVVHAIPIATMDIVFLAGHMLGPPQDVDGAVGGVARHPVEHNPHLLEADRHSGEVPRGTRAQYGRRRRVCVGSHRGIVRAT